MATTFCVSGAVLKRAGLNVNASLSAGTILLSASNFIVDTWINDAECFINSATKRNWIDIYSSLNSDVKDILRDICSNKAAIDAIGYDTSGYTSTEQATLLMDKCDNNYKAALEILKDDDTSLWITRQ